MRVPHTGATTRHSTARSKAPDPSGGLSQHKTTRLQLRALELGQQRRVLHGLALQEEPVAAAVEAQHPLVGFERVKVGQEHTHAPALER
jgi:hypothetical protein